MTVRRLLPTSHGTNREAFTGLDWVLFASISLIWGSSFLFMEIGLDAFHPGLITWLRVVFGAVVIALVPRARRSSTPISPAHRPRIMGLGAVWIALPLTLFPLAQQWIDSAVAGMLNGAVPIFTAVLAAFLLRAVPGRLQIFGVVIGFAGIVAVALPSAGTGSTAALGVLLVLVATVCYAVALNMVTPLQQTYGSLPVLARAQWVAAALVTPFGLYGLARSSFSWASLLAVLAVGIFGTGLAFVFMSSLAGRVGATRAAFINYLVPVVAMVLGVVFLDEAVVPLAVVGVALVILGAALGSRREAPTSLATPAAAP
ncbi:MAG TPA: DMT family transporter [Acidimicrobiia bacterium]|nr:DMT family transporter [Acidimicrobiia bacterium]